MAKIFYTITALAFFLLSCNGCISNRLCKTGKYVSVHWHVLCVDRHGNAIPGALVTLLTEDEEDKGIYMVSGKPECGTFITSNDGRASGTVILRKNVYLSVEIRKNGYFQMTERNHEMCAKYVHEKGAYFSVVMLTKEEFIKTLVNGHLGLYYFYDYATLPTKADADKYIQSLKNIKEN